MGSVPSARMNSETVVKALFCTAMLLFILSVISQASFVCKLREKHRPIWENIGRPSPWIQFGSPGTSVSKFIWTSGAELRNWRLFVRATHVALYFTIIAAFIVSVVAWRRE